MTRPYRLLLAILTALLLLTPFLLLDLLAYNGNPPCPRDRTDSFWTGKTSVSERGEMLYGYKCLLYSHFYWSLDRPGSL